MTGAFQKRSQQRGSEPENEFVQYIFHMAYSAIKPHPLLPKCWNSQSVRLSRMTYPLEGQTRAIRYFGQIRQQFNINNTTASFI